MLFGQNPKIGSFVVDRNIIDLYYKIGGFGDRKSIDLLTTSIRKASEMRLAYGARVFRCDYERGVILLEGGQVVGTQPTITPLIRNPPNEVKL